MAPLIARPSAYHWYVKLVPLVQVPGLAVTRDPTASVPLIFGEDAVSVPAMTAFVAALVRTSVVKPGSVHVTRTLIFLPSCATPGVKLAFVAPAMSTPAARH